MAGFSHSVADDINNLRSLLSGYQAGFPVFKELLQNADDAGASELIVGYLPGIEDPPHLLLAHPAIIAVNDGPFSVGDSIAIRQFGGSSKSSMDAAVGKYGLGLKSIFHLCDAFFYMGSDGARGALHTGFLNPWSPAFGSDEIPLHPEWDEVSDDVWDRLITMLKDALGNSWIGEPDTEWFALWVPLRKEESGSDVIQRTYPGDLSPDEWLLPGLSKQMPSIELAEALPMLKTLRNVAIVSPGAPQTGDELPVVRIGVKSATRSWSLGQSPAVGKWDLRGTIETGIEDSSSLTFAGFESAIKDPDLDAILRSDNWPRRSEQQGTRIREIPEKAGSHGAAYFVKSPAESHRGHLNISWSVFLPVQKLPPISTSLDFDISLLLHGYFFVDSSRTRIEFDSEQQTNKERQVQAEWNTQLRDRVVLPQIVQALGNFCREADLESPEISSLTRALEKWATGPGSLEAICRERQWLIQWSGETFEWATAAVEGSFIEVPECSPELFLSCFPLLSKRLGDMSITFTSKPRLTTKSASPWPSPLLESALHVAPELFRDAVSLAYFIRFLKERAADIEMFEAARSVLVSSVRAGLRGMPLSYILQNQAMLLELVAVLPGSAKFGVPLDLSSIVANEIWEKLSALDVSVIIVPDNLAPPANDQPIISAADAGAIFTVLTGIDVASDPRGVEAVGNVAIVVSESVVTEGANFLESVTTLAVFPARDFRTGQRSLVNHKSLLQAAKATLLFTRNADRASKLQKALRTAQVLIVDQRVARLVIGSDSAGIDCAPSACIEVLRQPQNLTGPEERKDLFVDLLTSSQGVAQRGNSWQYPLRFLLHGDVEQMDSEDSLIIWNQGQVAPAWAKLATSAIAAADASWRIVPTELADVIAPIDYGLINIESLNVNSCISTIENAGAENIDCSGLTDDEIDRVFVDSDDSTTLVDLSLEDLRIHEDQSGVLCSIESNTYLISVFPIDDTLSDRVHVIKLRGSIAAQSVQARLFGDKTWTAQHALQFALATAEPHLLASSILVGLRLAGHQYSSELGQSIRDTSWLTTKDGEAIAGKVIIHIPDLEDEIRTLQILEVAGIHVSSSLEIAFLGGEVLSVLERDVFMDTGEGLQFLGLALGEDDRFKIGSLALSATHDALEMWLLCFSAAGGDEAMPSSSIVRDLWNAQDGRYQDEIRQFLLPEIEKPLTDRRYVNILNYLIDLDETATYGTRASTLFSKYLEDARDSANVRDGILPEIRLLNQNGNWTEPHDLCVPAPNISQEHILASDHLRILQGTVSDSVVPRIDIHSAQGVKVAADPAAIVDYLQHLETAGCPPAVIGAFTALLGGDPILKSAASGWLAHETWTLDLVRRLFGWISQPERSPSGWIASDEFEPVIETQGFSFQLVPHGAGATVAMTNLIGGAFEANLTEEPQQLIVGHLANWPISTEVGRPREVSLPLLDFVPESGGRARDLLKAAAEDIWRSVYLQPDDLDRLWEVVGGEDQLDVRTAQHLITENLLFLLTQIRLPKNEKLDSLAQEWRELRSRRAQEKLLLDRGMEPEYGSGLETTAASIQGRLSKLITSDDGVRTLLYEAVKNTVSDAQYEPGNIVFELFQNADDASAELQNLGVNRTDFEVAVLASKDVLTFVHWGRKINQFKIGTRSVQTFKNDLENMLVMHASQKTSDDDGSQVTGKFGLGFKSVFLVSDRPRVVSGLINFQVDGGVYPEILESDVREQMVEAVQESGLSARNVTIIQLPIVQSEEHTPDVLLARFASLSSILTVFARSTRTIEIFHTGADERVTWDPEVLGSHPAIELGQISRGGDVKRALVIRGDNNSALLIGMADDGVVGLSGAIPSLWVTAPTSETSHIKFAMNGMFAIDPGRSRISVESPENKLVVSSIQDAVGSAFESLAQRSVRDWPALRSELGLVEAITAYDFWQGVWDLFGSNLWRLREEHRESADVRLAIEVFWDSENAAMINLMEVRNALPTMLSGRHQVLTKAADVTHSIAGRLKDPEVFRIVSEWPRFGQSYPPGSLISDEDIGAPIRHYTRDGHQIEVLNLYSALNSEIDGNRMSAVVAKSVGKAITDDLMDALGAGTRQERDEFEGLRSLLKPLQFKTRSGGWASSEDLLIIDPALTDNEDEALRAAFAPDDRVLSVDYGSLATEFFRLARDGMRADTEELLGWAIGVEPDQRQAVLRYLLIGELNKNVAARVRSTKARNWLDDITVDSELLVEFDGGEKLQLLGLLGAQEGITWVRRPTSSSPPMQRDPAEVLGDIAEWWMDERTIRTQEYEKQIYPDGFPEALGGDISDLATRKSWLELLIIGSTFTMGRTTPQQNAGFLRTLKENGWLDEIAKPEPSDIQWSDLLQSYFDKNTYALQYFHWLQQFVPMYQLSTWLDDYIQIFLDLDKRGKFELRDILIPRLDAAYQGTGLGNAPPLGPALGYGASFVIRELLRKGVITSEYAHPHAFVPQLRVRQLIERLGCDGLADEDRMTYSSAIFDFLDGYLGDDTTFSGSFDLPLWFVATDKNGLWSRFLEEPPPPPDESGVYDL